MRSSPPPTTRALPDIFSPAFWKANSAAPSPGCGSRSSACAMTRGGMASASRCSMRSRNGRAATASVTCTRRRRGTITGWCAGSMRWASRWRRITSSTARCTAANTRRARRSGLAARRRRTGARDRLRGRPATTTSGSRATTPTCARWARDDLAEIVRIDRDITGRDRHEYMKHKLNETMVDSAIRVSLAARLEGAIVGFLMARADLGDFGRTEPVAVIDTIGVDPGYAHRGVGHALVSQLFAEPRRAAHRARRDRGRAARFRAARLSLRRRLRARAAVAVRAPVWRLMDTLDDERCAKPCARSKTRKRA